MTFRFRDQPVNRQDILPDCIAQGQGGNNVFDPLQGSMAVVQVVVPVKRLLLRGVFVIVVMVRPGKRSVRMDLFLFKGEMRAFLGSVDPNRYMRAPDSAFACTAAGDRDTGKSERIQLGKKRIGIPSRIPDREFSLFGLHVIDSGGKEPGAESVVDINDGHSACAGIEHGE